MIRSRKNSNNKLKKANKLDNLLCQMARQFLKMLNKFSNTLKGFLVLKKAMSKKSKTKCIKYRRTLGEENLQPKKKGPSTSKCRVLSEMKGSLRLNKSITKTMC